MKINYVIDKKSTIKEFIIERVSRNFYGYLKELNAIYRLNGEEKKASEELNINDKLEVEYYGIDKQEGLLSFNELEIVYEDSCFIVIDKPAHLLTIPSNSLPSDSVYNRLLAYFGKTDNTIHIVNRLDKETRGLVLVCKNKLARASLREFDKVYVAKTTQMLPSLKGKITDLIRKSDDGIKRVVDPINGDIAITNYELMDINRGIFTYKINLETGRTHQIRVHFSYYRCPILGDQLYGGEPYEEMQLTCKEINFIHPFDRKKYHFESRY